MITERNEQRIKQVSLLLDRKMLEIYQNYEGDPTKSAMLFFGDIPNDILVKREDALAGKESFTEWILITDECFNTEWLESLRGDYGVDVILVEDLAAVRVSLLL